MDIILDAYFDIFPVGYFLLFIAIGISVLIIRELYSFFDN